MCSEEKFMESVRHPQRLRKHKISDGSAEKRTRFVDIESIGNFSAYIQTQLFFTVVLEMARRMWLENK